LQEVKAVRGGLSSLELVELTAGSKRLQRHAGLAGGYKLRDQFRGDGGEDDAAAKMPGCGNQAGRGGNETDVRTAVGGSGSQAGPGGEQCRSTQLGHKALGH